MNATTVAKLLRSKGPRRTLLQLFMRIEELCAERRVDIFPERRESIFQEVDQIWRAGVRRLSQLNLDPEALVRSLAVVQALLHARG